MGRAKTVMQCMEVWGGNQIAEQQVTIHGLDAWVYARPHGQSASGGDVYYVSSCATGRVTRLLIADVSGHGDVVSATAESLRTLMRRFVNHIDQRQFVKSMNGEFVKLSEAGSFATALVTTYFAPTRTLLVCNAGHPPPMIYRAKTGQWEVAGLKDQGIIPLGIAESDDYSEANLKLSRGDLVMCYTDSLIEARSAGQSDCLGIEGLRRVLADLDPADPAAMTTELLKRIDLQKPNGLDGDDVTVMIFRPNGAGIRLIDRVLAPLRVLGAIAARPFTGRVIPWPECSVANLLGWYRREA